MPGNILCMPPVDYASRCALESENYSRIMGNFFP